MDKAKRDSAARAFVSACGKVYAGKHGPPPIDLQSVQGIADYADPVVQKKYVHMYFAKYVTLWRVVRQRIDDRSGSILSVGAGPCLDLFGWFWDNGPSTGPVHGIDVQPWSAIHAMKEWKGLVAEVVPTLTFESSVVVPAAEHVPQSACVAELKAYPAMKVPRGGTVLFPFSVNHCVGVKDSTTEGGRQALAAWIASVRSKGARVVIGDMHILKNTKPFWQFLCNSLGVTATPEVLTFETELQQLASLYIEEAHRRCSHFMSKAAVLVLDADGARFLK